MSNERSGPLYLNPDGTTSRKRPDYMKGPKPQPMTNTRIPKISDDTARRIAQAIKGFLHD